MAINLQTFEVELLIIPSFAIFLAFIVPVPLVSKLVSKLVLAVESVTISGVSLLLICSIASFGLFVNQYTRVHQIEDRRPTEFIDIAAKLDFQARKWRSERDLYIHAVTFILLAAVMKFARLIRDREKLQKEANVAVATAAADNNKKKQ